jgi:hypothetical protein
VRAFVVVDLPEFGQLFVQPLHGVRAGLPGEPFFQGLVEALDFALGLRVVRGSAVYLSPEDLALTTDRIKPHYSLFIRFLGGTALRYSEATALRRRYITIRQGRTPARFSRAWKSKGKGEEIGRQRHRRPTAQRRATPRCPPRLQVLTGSRGFTSYATRTRRYCARPRYAGMARHEDPQKLRVYAWLSERV